MTFLPIVERELRVAARRWSTYWLRVVAAGVALVMGGGMLLLTLVPFSGQMQSGGLMFGTLTWISLAVALSAGLFFTSDCLSEEKREGTLGFLFLTDLRGYDVVLGKLLATSLRSVFPLLAIFPVLAMTQLLGGVEVGQFWRALLAIGNATFFSLTVGMFVSAISRHALKAMTATLLLLVILVGFGPLLDSLLGFVSGRFVPKLSLASPGYAFATADYGRNFWPALLVNQAVAWTLLGLACFLVRRTWQEKARQSAVKQSIVPLVGGVKRRPAARAKLLEKNPVTWLVARERGQAWAIWSVVVAMVLIGVLLLLRSDRSGEWWFGWNMINCLWLALYLWVAARASQLFADARRSGLVELLMASPLTSRETVQGAWRGLVRLFALPVLLLVGLQLFGQVAAGALNRGFVAGGNSESAWTLVVVALAGIVVVPMNLVALAWFGLWMGLTSKHTLTATLKTILFVQIIPWFVISFGSMMAIPLLLFASGRIGGSVAPSTTFASFWMPILFTGLPALLTLVKDVFLWWLARSRLYGSFRQLAVRSVVPVHVTSVPPVIAPAR